MQWNIHPALEAAEGKGGSIVIFIEKEQTSLPKDGALFSQPMRDALADFLASGDCKGAVAETAMLYARNEGAAMRIVCVGIGDRKQFDALTFQKAAGAAAQFLQNKKQDSWSYAVPAWMVKKFGAQRFGMLLSKAVLAATYHFDAYKTDEEKKVPPIREVTLLGVDARDRRMTRRGIEEGEILGAAINHTRDLGNLPPIEMTPAYLAREAQKLAKTYPALRVTVLDKVQIKKLGMGALLGVAAGSAEPPAFIVLEWFKGPKSKKPLVFVGKGITFDSGGISIKPGDKMDEMKYDMLGGGAVLGAMGAIAALGVKNNIVGLIPATENLPSGSAYRPGDILRTMGGKTIEVLNTDAEGRLILADALCYATRYEPRAVIDLATLTGACAYFMGPWHAGMFSPDDDPVRKVSAAARESGDEVWRLPLLPEHSKMVQSEVADVKNLGGKISGAATAAAFLKEFVSYPWVHLDIAGTAWTWDMKASPWMRAGATGYGVHLLVELAKAWR